MRGARLALLLALTAALGAGCGTERPEAGGRPLPTPTAPPVSPAPTLAPSVAPTPATCPASGIAISMPYPPDAAMGLRAGRIELANCGQQPYQLNGYPELKVLDESREPFEIDIHEGSAITTGVSDPGRKAFTLEPGEKAQAVIAWRNTVTLSDEPAVNGAYIEVVPRIGEKPQTVPVLIDLGNTGTLDVTAWHRQEPDRGPSPSRP